MKRFWRKDKLALFWGVFVIVLLYWHSIAMADDTGAKNAGTATEDASAGWSNIPPIDSVTSSNDTRSLTSTQDSLFLTNFSMGVPAGATVTAVIVSCEAQGSATQAARRRLDMHLVKNGRDIVGDHVAFNHDLDADLIVTLSGTIDSLWNTTWSVAEVNASTFGIATNKNASQAGNISIDHLTITVHYTPASDGVSGRRRRIIGL